MIRFAVRRILVSIPLIWALATLTFFIVRLAPGDPLAMYYNPEIDPEVMETIRVRLGLDQPLHIQYVKWLGSLAQGELGVSFSHHRPVMDILVETIPNTLVLTVFSLAMIVFSLKLGVLPASQMESVDAEYMAWGARLWDRALHLVMPVFVLGIASAASVARYMRSSLLEVIRQDYVRTARAKGLPERRVILRHALVNALIPIITLLGLYLPFLLSGAVVTETIFAWPGMGRLTIGAIFARDYPIVMATNLIAGVMVVAGNLVADLLYGIVDPRIRYE
jgi:peptide/nickel transport system permease protein